MGKRFTKFLSTIMLVGVLSGGLSGCVENTVIASNVVENKSSETPEQSYSDLYSSGDQIHKIAAAIGAQNERILSYNPEKNNQPIRLAHGNGEAIEVAFHPSFEEYKSYAIESLDYLFGVIGEINDNYQYKVVDFESEHDHNIVFKVEESGKYAGTASISSRIADDGVANIEWGIIKIYKDAFKNEDSKQLKMHLRNTITHEIMHVLGFDDVYIKETSEHFGNTLINPISQNNANEYAKLHLTPNDYNNLLSLYAKPSKNLDADIEKYKAMSEAYENVYYQNWLASEFENENPLLEALNKEEVYTFSQKCFSSAGSKDINFSLEISGDKYAFTVSDKNGNVLEKVNGDVTYLTTDINVGGKQITVKDSVALFENFESKYLYTNKYYEEDIQNSISNLFLYKSKGKFVLKDAFSYSNNEVTSQNELAIQMQ